jgi:hypothetical protein
MIQRYRQHGSPALLCAVCARALYVRALSEGRMMYRDIIIAPLPAKHSGNLWGNVIQANRVPIRLSPEVLVYRHTNSCIKKYKAGGQGKMRQVSFYAAGSGFQVCKLVNFGHMNMIQVAKTT